MGRMLRRIELLESREVERAELSPHAKAWLGLELTPAERAEMERTVLDTDFDEIDLSDFSPEVREWLQR